MYVKGVHALAFIAFLVGLAILAFVSGSCALEAGSIHDEGLYTVGLVPCTLADHLHCSCKDVECCFELYDLRLFSIWPSGIAHLGWSSSLAHSGWWSTTQDVFGTGAMFVCM